MQQESNYGGSLNNASLTILLFVSNAICSEYENKILFQLHLCVMAASGTVPYFSPSSGVPTSLSTTKGLLSARRII